MARGTDDVQLALDMSKYFDTNYRARYKTRSWLEDGIDHWIEVAGGSLSQRCYERGFLVVVPRALDDEGG